MPKYSWEGKNANGQDVSGEIEAKDVQAVFIKLKAQKITPYPTKIKEKGKGLDAAVKLPKLTKSKGKKIKHKSVVVFTRQFATMIDAGLPLAQALGILASQADTPAFKEVLRGVKEHVESGGTLSDGMAKFPKAFDQLYCNMVAAGERGGILDTILERLSIHMEKAHKLQREIKTAMIYPSVVVAAAVIVSSVLLLFVIPTFAELFQDFGSALPMPTQMVINLSNFFVSYWYLIFGSAFGAFYLLKRFLRTERGKEVAHPLILKAPVFGDLIRKVAVARFTRTMGTMLSSGVAILDSLAICAKNAGNKVVEREVLRCRTSISEGKNMSEPLKQSIIFPPMVVQMISVGESTGAMDAMLQKIAEFYEEEVDNAVGALKQMIEPVMILVLGTVIGALVIAMYLPIFKMGAAVG